MSAISVSQLERLAVDYQNDLRYYTYAQLIPELGALGINLIPGIQDTHKVLNFERKQGIAKPYAPSITPEDADVGTIKEMALKVELAYSRVKDNIQNYKEVVVVRPGEMIGANKTKKHPFEVQLMMNMVRTFGEDVLDALFNGDRDIEDKTPMGLFDGFETKVLAFIASGDITGGKGNYRESDAMDAPADASDTDAYDNLVAWLNGADPYLLKNANLILPRAIANNAYQAMKNKTAQKAATFIDFKAYLQDDIGVMSNLNIIPTQFAGLGDRMYLTAPGNMDFGMNSMGDEAFVQVLPVDGDPNNFYYWIQASFGTRWRALHKKVFYTNNGTLTANQLSGDYS